MSISYVKYREIDFKKWDKCIKTAFNGTICALSWYLDLMCYEWDALIEDNYIRIMPLVTKRILGFDVIFNPDLVKGLGIFSRRPITSEITEQFLRSIPSHYVHYHIVLNKYNPLQETRATKNKSIHYNLDLIRPYSRIAGNFSPETRQKLNKAKARHLSFTKGLSPNDLIVFIQQQKIPVRHSVSDQNFKLLRSISANLIRYSNGDIFGVYNEHNELGSVAILAWMNNRIILLYQAVDPEQTKDNPHLFLIDRIIEKYSETNSVLGFEFIDTEFNQGFYSGFGAHVTRLSEIRSGKIPFYIRPFIRL